jgi:hypothetical protein
MRESLNGDSDIDIMQSVKKGKFEFPRNIHNN